MSFELRGGWRFCASRSSLVTFVGINRDGEGLGAAEAADEAGVG